jgi:hemerythrin
MISSSELIWQDKQHQILFELIDEISSGSADQAIFARLTDYAENHFVIEEEYMARLNYPGTEDHVRAHDKFRQELRSMVEHGHEYDEAVRSSLTLFLSEWLKRHIFGIDKKLEQFVLESGSK